MPRTKPQTVELRTWVPERNCAMDVEIELPLHFRAEVRKTVEGSALTLTYYEQACVLRERAEGTIVVALLRSSRMKGVAHDVVAEQVNGLLVL